MTTVLVIIMWEIKCSKSDTFNYLIWVKSNSCVRINTLVESDKHLLSGRCSRTSTSLTALILLCVLFSHLPLL